MMDISNPDWENIVKKATITIFLLLSILSTGTSFSYTGEIGSQCKTETFKDDAFSFQSDQFSIYEKVYLLIQCKGLPEGAYSVYTQWMDEEGRPQTKRVHKFNVASQRDYSVAFKFKQIPKGTLRKLSSGQDFEDYQYGKWSVLTFINDDQVERKYFTITD